MHHEQPYRHLMITVSRWWLLRQRGREFLGRVLYRMPLLAHILRGVGHRLVFIGKRLVDDQSNRLHYMRLLAEDGSGSEQFGSPYGYSDAIQELSVADKYYRQLQSKDFDTMVSESAGLYAHTIKMLTGLFHKDPGITSFLDFGVGYGYIESVLAKKHPSVHFVGIDRSKFTKLFNDEQFLGIKNLEFIAGDVFTLLKTRRFDGGVFFHARTLLLLPPSFIKKLYIAVAAAGFRYIVGMEQFGISRQTFKFYEFSDEEKPSEWYRLFMYAHNYPGLLKTADFTTTSTELVKTNHPHPDYRFLSFIGEKK